ncbi:MAG: hypothetical protein IK118_08360, partial [Clostridia bacterium]|nr:hypothetical protein [Clostridia bacterium]
MNTISSRAKILYALAGLFLVGAILVALTFVLHGDEYAMNSRNRHIYSGNVLISGGDAFSNSNDILREYLAELCDIPHLDLIRFGTKMPVVL